MALITINGVDIPTPASFDVGIADISNSQRNANGMLLIERIATKKQLSLSYLYLSAADLKTILNAVSPVFFNVTYLDPVTDSNVTGSFYCYDRNMGMIDFIDGVARYKDLKFSLSER